MSLDEMPLADFFDRLDADSHSLVVVNRTAPRPFQRKLERAFDDQPVTIEEDTSPTVRTTWSSSSPSTTASGR